MTKTEQVKKAALVLLAGVVLAGIGFFIGAWLSVVLPGSAICEGQTVSTETVEYDTRFGPHLEVSQA